MPPSSHDIAQRLAALRGAVQAKGLYGLIVPHNDEYMNEYLPAAHERLAWVSGFTGSEGKAVLLPDCAALFIDGRYTVQAEDQTDAALFSRHHLQKEPFIDWLVATAPAGSRIAFDPWLHRRAEIEAWTKQGRVKDLTFQPLAENLIDAVWSDRPALPKERCTPYPEAYAGMSHGEKRRQAAGALKNEVWDRAVLTQPDEIAWLLNIRGEDVAHTPLCLCRAVLHTTGAVELFIDPDKLGADVLAHLSDEVTVHTEEAFPAALAALAKGQRILVDRQVCPVAILDTIEKAGAVPVEASSLISLPRARKNETEREGARKAQRRDAVPMVRFLKWLEEDALAADADELSAAAQLRAYREATGELMDISFSTISAAGAHAALPHYFPTSESNAPLTRDEIYLVDSGGQYRDGTTDITRTLVLGTPSDVMRDRFTRVLKGHIAIAEARFPAGTTGRQLDILARQALWQAGFSFDHGTGHGVGCYLSVHEGPQSISPAARSGETALEPGMILSNEPGYYSPGAFGIRIENLVLVREATVPEGGEVPMHSFETLTLVPMDRKLIDLTMLTTDERAWMDAYHARVLDEIGPLVPPEDKAWLTAACRPL
ncbi:MAG: aminopeptidase P family protein [Pseudomonadota bacterium]